MNPKILSEEAIRLYDVAKELKKVRKGEEEPNIRTKKLEEYLASFVTLKPKQAEELEAELVKLEIPRLRDLHIKKIMDVLPTSSEEVKLVLSAYPVTISKENLNKIADLVSKYVPAKAIA